MAANSRRSPGRPPPSNRRGNARAPASSHEWCSKPCFVPLRCVSPRRQLQKWPHPGSWVAGPGALNARLEVMTLRPSSLGRRSVDSKRAGQLPQTVRLQAGVRPAAASEYRALGFPRIPVPPGTSDLSVLVRLCRNPACRHRARERRLRRGADVFGYREGRPCAIARGCVDLPRVRRVTSLGVPKLARTRSAPRAFCVE